MRMSAYVTPSLRAVFSATSASAFLSMPFAAASSAAVTLVIQEGREASDIAPAATPAVFKKSRREVVIVTPHYDAVIKEGDRSNTARWEKSTISIPIINLINLNTLWRTGYDALRQL